MSRGRDHCIDPKRRRIHRAMRRHGRPTVDARRIQSERARGSPAVEEMVRPPENRITGQIAIERDKAQHDAKERRGFLRRVFNRKTGGS